jgi:ADP-ribosylglycohydrolase/predicted enzyme related to lactoylglutathione lyase
MDAMTVDSNSRDAQAADRAEGAFLGAAVGDALGWPVEDRGGRVGGTRSLEPAFEFIAWRRREGGKHQPHEEEIAPGSYSDDTQLMLAVARARLAGDGWWSHLTQHELPFWLLYERGGGGATKRAASSWSRGNPPWSDKGVDRYFAAGGNGAAMRIVPHALTSEPFEDVARAVIADGITTHGHPRALVGAVLQAYAIWRGFRQRGVLGYGELIEAVLDSDGWRAFSPPVDAPDWEDLASHGFDRPYRDIWRDTVDEADGMLLAARDGIARGSLAVDRPVLEQLGAFGKSSGAGTVSAVAATFLASRYAAQPSSGVVAASFAKGADTDTLAAMTGAILGAIHGADWVGSISRGIEDGQYVRQLARRVVEPIEPSEVDSEPSPPTTRRFWRAFGEPQPGERVELPGGRVGQVTAVITHETKRSELLPLTWVVEVDDGQILRFKRVKKAPPGVGPASGGESSRAAASTVEADRRPRIGVVLHVSDFSRARSFYERVVGLQISKEAPGRTVFEGLLALEPLPRSLQPAPSSRQLAFENQELLPSFDTTSAVTIYLHMSDFEDVRARIEREAIPLGEVRAPDGRPTFRCLDPDGNVVEFRARNGS